MITENRLREMEDLFWAETNDPETEEWRDELTPEEEELVKGWDDDCAAGMSRLARDILKREERDQIPAERDQEMYRYWQNETRDPETKAWRESLTLPEERLVKDWDRWHKEGALSKGPKRWEIITKPNCVDNYDRPCRHARCPECGFKWTDLYSVQNYFKHCPGCGTALLWPE